MKAQQAKFRGGISHPQGCTNACKSLADVPESGLCQDFSSKTETFCHNKIADALSPTSRKG
jgi:hypothetical protein